MSIKKTFHCFNILVIFIVCLIFNSCRTTNKMINNGRDETVRSVSKKESGATVSTEEIPILAWYGVKEHTIERYRELKECGIDYNLTYVGIKNIEELAHIMNTSKEAGIKIIIHCPELYDKPEMVAKRFKDHPTIVGYHLKDEPSRNDFSNLGKFVQRIKAVDNQHFSYINLFPNYASSEQLRTSTYREYVQLFLQEVPIQILSFDHYPIRLNDSGVRSLNSEWYENLEIISDEASKAGIPFWAFALTTAHKPYPIPTLADLRLQVYSNLAYGAQGIQYFTYWTPSINEGFDFHDGPIENNTKQKTPTWYTVQQMNREIKALSSVFLGAKVIKVEHIATDASGKNGALPKSTTRFDFAKRPLEASIIKTFAIPSNTNALVSFLKNGNRCYMVIVNRNLDGGDNVTFTITGGSGLQLIKKDGKAVPASSENSTQTVTPGDALIYGWDVKN